MTDRELLELAARAEGYKVLGLASKWIAQGVSEHALLYRNDRGGNSVFDPLTDPGDALRLAVQLQLTVYPPTDSYRKACCQDFNGEIDATEDGTKDPLAATMRAIVRAAADIGRTKT